MTKDYKNLQKMIQKLESLKGKSVDLIDYSQFSELTPLYTKYIENYTTLHNGNYLILDVSRGVIKEAYLDCEKINTLPVFYIYFPLDVRWDGVLMNNFYIGIRSGNIKMALYCLETISPILSKSIFVAFKKPSHLKPYKLIKSSYREQGSLYGKARYRAKKKVENLKIIKEMEL